MTFPSGLQSLTFGAAFDQNLEDVTFPSGLQSLTFGAAFNQNLEGVTFPSGLQSLTFGVNLYSPGPVCFLLMKPTQYNLVNYDHN